MATGTIQFSELQTDFFGLGFSRLNDASTGLTRAKRYLNLAYKELVLEELWSFRETDATGAAPLTVTDLGVVASVVDTATRNPLTAVERQTLVDAFTILTTTGAPTYFYLVGNIVNTFPVGGTLSVHYWKVPAALSAASDVMIVPDEYYDAVIYGAGRRAALRESQDTDLSAALEGERQRIVKLMTEECLSQVQDNFPMVGVHGEDW